MVLQHFKNGGGTLAVDVQGEGPLVICHPGMGDVRDAYDPLAAILVANGYTVASVDPRGHGDSTTDFNSYGDEATADDFIFLAQTLNKGPAVLAGDSFSAGSATIAAGKRPELVAGTILLGPFLRLSSGAWILSVTKAMFAKPWGPWLWQQYASTLWPGLGAAKAKERAAASRAQLTRPGHWAAFQATVAGADHRVVGPWIGKVQAPVLVVMGDKDPDFKPVEEADWVASQFKDAEKVMVPNAGHAPMLESPDLVGEKTLAFLQKLKSEGRFGQ